MKGQLFTFYFATSTKKPQFRPVAALAFNYVFDLIQSPGYLYPMTLLLDELTNYGYIPELPDKLTHIRHQEIGAVLGIQHPVQLTKVYGDKDALLLMTQPGTRMYFRPRDTRTAETISRSLGNKTLQIRKVTPTGGIYEDERQRPLMDPSEVLRLPKSKTVALTPTTDPLIVDNFHFTEHDEFTTQPPPPRRKIEVDERLVRLCTEASADPQWKPLADKEVADFSKQHGSPDRSDTTPHSTPGSDPSPDKVAREPELEPGQEGWQDDHFTSGPDHSGWHGGVTDDRDEPGHWSDPGLY